MIKAIIFDCFGVLYIPVGEDFYRSHVPEYKKHSDKLRALGQQADLGNISQDELVAGVAQLMELPTEEVRSKLVSGLARNNTLLKFSQSLRPAHKVGLLSNISAGTVDQFFTQVDQLKLFDTAVVSSQVGLAKPDPAIFTLTAKNLGVDPRDCLMIDDSPANCSGAQQAGMKAILYKSTEQAIADVKKAL